MEASPAASSVWLGLGANLGSPRRQLLFTLLELSRTFGAVRVGPLYRTAPVSPIPQPPYLNTVAEVRTALAPMRILDLAKALEAAAGRRAGPRHAPRPLDVDILLVGDLELSSERLTVPHPSMRDRTFVLSPLADAAPDLRLPPDGVTVSELLTRASGAGCERLAWSAAVDCYHL